MSGVRLWLEGQGGLDILFRKRCGERKTGAMGGNSYTLRCYGTDMEESKTQS